ncbi:MAG: hypothetical protein ACE5G9_11105 [Nitrospinales bacterium]
MRKKVACRFSIVVALITFLAFLSPASAGTRLEIADDKWVNFGFGLKSSYKSVENGALTGKNRLNDFEVQNIRLYITSQIQKGIKVTFNTDFKPDTGNLVLLDGAAKFRFNNWFNIWGGRFHIPSDRTNHSGPYNLNAWDLPFVQKLPNFAFGRDNGAAVWGTNTSGKFKYQFGAYQGRRNNTNSQSNPNQETNLLYAGKLQYNFWDTEAGYGNKNSYFGKKDILAIAFVAMHQDDGAGTQENPGAYNEWSIDFLFEKKLANKAVVTLDFTYYDYDLEDVADAKLIGGEAFYVSGNYLFPRKFGWGQIQPYVRYQEFNRDSTNRVGERGRHDRIEGGINYIIDGHNAKIALFYFSDDPGPGQPNADTIKIGAQVQF